MGPMIEILKPISRLAKAFSPMAVSVEQASEAIFKLVAAMPRDLVLELEQECRRRGMLRYKLLRAWNCFKWIIGLRSHYPF